MGRGQLLEERRSAGRVRAPAHQRHEHVRAAGLDQHAGAGQRRREVDVAASLAAAGGLLAAGGTDLFVSLMGWCPDPARAPAFLEELAAAARAAP